VIGVRELTNLRLVGDNMTLAAERDNAIIQRDQARREKANLETQLRIVTSERDEARALGRCA
jgi:hypothetical protein